jgi:hypothetical protein
MNVSKSTITFQIKQATVVINDIWYWINPWKHGPNIEINPVVIEIIKAVANIIVIIVPELSSYEKIFKNYIKIER